MTPDIAKRSETTTAPTSGDVATGDRKPSVAAHTIQAAVYAALGCTKIDFRSPLKVDQATAQIVNFVKSSEEYADMLAALEAQHEAIDILLALLIERDNEFMPTKSQVWPMLLQGNAAIAKAKATGA